MKTQLTMTAAIAFLAAFSIGGDVLADPPSHGGESKFAVTMPFVNVGWGGLDLALCADADGDDQCDNAVAFITKTGHWGIRIPGVESDGAEPFRVCMTYLDPNSLDFGALLLSENLYLIGPNNVLSAGGSLYADVQGYLDVVLLPGFAVQRWDGSYPTGCWGHLNEFVTGIRID
jgi:hypothetical protein